MPIERYTAGVRMVKPDRPKPAAHPHGGKNTAMGYFAMVAVLAICLYGVVDSVRRLAAETWIANPVGESLDRAVKLTPGNGLAWLRLGQRNARRGDPPAQVVSQLRRAVELEPHSSEAHIALALQLERAGDLEGGEIELLRAADVDRTHGPAIALANYYVRRGDSERFWHWLQTAAGISPAGLEQAIDLCWRAIDDPAMILEKGVPDTPSANNRYLQFLLDSQRIEAAEPVWRRMKNALQPSDGPLAAFYVGQLIGRGEISRALNVWNRMCTARLLPYAPLSPADGPLITNGNFEREPTGIGFDWRAHSAEGVYCCTLERLSSGGSALAIELGGNQGESLTLLEQIVPLAADASYEFSFRYRTAGLPDETGIWAAIDNLSDGARLGRSETLPASESNGERTISLRTPPGADGARLLFGYERAKGTARQKGTIWLSGLELLPAGASRGKAR